MDNLDGIITKVICHKPSPRSQRGSKFLIAALMDGSKVKGEMSRPVVGERYRFYGEWREQKKPYGAAFEFLTFEPIVDRSADGIAAYLARHVPGLGPARSAAVVDAFGIDTLDTLRREPERVASLPGLSPAIAQNVAEFFRSDESADAATEAELSEMFAGHHVPRSVVKVLIDTYHGDAPARVRENPYLLLHLPRMGWPTVDSFARSVVGYDPSGLSRHVAAVAEALQQIARDGHTYAYRPDIEVVAFGLLGGPVRGDAWDAACQPDPTTRETRIVRDVDDQGESFALLKLDHAERTVASRIASLSRAGKPLGFEIDTTGLHGEQVNAVRIVERAAVAIIAGAPGTGKSYTIAQVVKELASRGGASIKVAAPTGKAAKRAAELIAAADVPVSIPCTTIHRLLAPKPSGEPEGIAESDAKIGRGREEFGFGHDEENPIEASHLVIDECSMVDIELAASLVRAIAPGTRVVFVGDQHQLPSVGPGSVLRDMIESVPAAYLTEIRRSRPGRIIRACHAILAGHTPEPASRIDLANGENWVHVEVDDPHEIARQIVELHRPMKAFPDPVWDIQVVTPQRARLPIACENLNQLLSARLNHRASQEASENGPDPARYTPEFQCGDKVVRTKNGVCDEMHAVDDMDADGFDWSAGEFVPRAVRAATDGNARPEPDWSWDGRDWCLRETDVVNGDMGQVVAIVQGDRDDHVIVRFRTPDRLCRLPYRTCHLTAAYAMTCHKAQGSGFPFVIVPVHHTFYWDAREQRGIFNREWIYTAMSRAERLLVTVGQFSAIEAAVRRKTVHRRQSRLAGLLKEAMR